MRSSNTTLLSLFEWSQLLGINPWELAQVGAGFDNEHRPQCDHVFFQQSYQQDFLSRDEVASCIEQAEFAIAQQLGYWPAPKFIEETVDYPQPASDDPYQVWRPTVQLKYRYVLGGGSLARTPIDLAAAVTRQDLDGDTIKEQFTLTVATTVTNPDELALYTVAADRDGDALDETWRIRPVQIVIAAGQATITGHAALLVVPNKTRVTDPDVLNVTDDANYVTTVAVYRVYRDTTATEATPAQGWALWDAWPNDCIDPLNTSQPTRPIAIGERNALNGHIWTAYDDFDTCQYAGAPARVYARYLAGKPLSDGRMDRTMAMIVAKLATALLPVDKCGCERSSRIIHYWRSLPTEGEESAEGGRPVTFKEIDTPFGERRGATWAWQRVKAIKLSGATYL